jgi:hypothetical protein
MLEPIMQETETTELKKSLAELKQGLISRVAMLNKHGHPSFPAVPSRDYRHAAGHGPEL